MTDKAVELENMFYEADDTRTSNPVNALALFKRIAESESRNSRDTAWRFRALVQVVVISCKLNKLESLGSKLDDLFTIMDSVTRNEASDGLNQVLDALSAQSDTNGVALESAYERILHRLWAKGVSAQPLWFGTAVKLARLYFENTSIDRDADLESLVAQMRSTCCLPDGSDDIAAKGSQLLELYSIELQRISKSKTKTPLRRLKDVMNRCLQANSAVANPRSMAIIREHAGKILMSESRFGDAYSELFEAFRAYSDSGNPRSRTVLKYAVLANMFSLSSINPFDSREAKAYQDDPEIDVMLRLRKAYDQHDLDAIEGMLGDPGFLVATDAFIQSYIEPLLHRIKLQCVESFCKAHRSISITTLYDLVNTDRSIVTRMVMRLILDGQINARIDGDIILMDTPMAPVTNELLTLRNTVAFLGEYASDCQDRFKELIDPSAKRAKQ